MSIKDETYVLDICDEILGLTSSRQHRFSFLTGDSGRRLPVDAYYADIALVVEFHERQHYEDVTIFDKPDKMTCSGVSRREQRKLYDQRRRDILPQHGIELVVLSVRLFEQNRRKQLRRDRAEDEIVIRYELSRYVRQASLVGRLTTA